MDKQTAKYVPSWTRKSPCVPTKRSKLTVCVSKKDDSQKKEETEAEGTQKVVEKESPPKNVIDLRESPVYSYDDMALRLVAPFPSEDSRYLN